MKTGWKTPPVHLAAETTEGDDKYDSSWVCTVETYLFRRHEKTEQDGAELMERLRKKRRRNLLPGKLLNTYLTHIELSLLLLRIC